MFSVLLIEAREVDHHHLTQVDHHIQYLDLEVDHRPVLAVPLEVLIAVRLDRDHHQYQDVMDPPVSLIVVE